MSYTYEFDEALICFICGVDFEQQEFLKVHLSEHLQTTETIEIQPIGFLETELNKNQFNYNDTNFWSNADLPLQSNNVNMKEMYECIACGKEFKRKDHLQKHVIIHSDAKPFPCLVCGKRFARKDRLKDHCVIHLANGWSCYFCGRMFSQRCILRKHEMTHRGVKPFSCELCDCRFSRKNDLLRHLTVHSGEKNHLCEVCGKRFSQKRLLKRHLNIHRNN
ncbi:hypothetical protein JTE90_028710 [Oedothorax gibbosus]|uniref:Zinc finger protein 865 n=1 Tax=Oedothorax gibbosus TaxID=931172 RepID=A0AAV6U4A1_9ARAC|nr:hypothetical protein JTE90_028710 [Oedothorax gibbosus]